MATIYEAPADKYNSELAKALKTLEQFKMPEWAGFVKTSVSRARPPADSDFWYHRAASILRQIYIRGVVGVGRLKTKYGGNKERGGKPKEFRKGSGKIIRTILQQAETAGFLKKSEARKKGRELTKEGLDFLNQIAEKVISAVSETKQEQKIEKEIQKQEENEINKN